jgi:serine/threonine protein kinase
MTVSPGGRDCPCHAWPNATRRPNFAPSPSDVGIMRDPLQVLRPALAARYEIEREIASGAAATVYLARDLRHDRPVALKVLRADSATPTIDEARFVREIRLLARLQHPFILPLHDSGHVEEVIYYVAPYVIGESLRERLERERKLPVSAAFQIVRDVAEALDCAHRHGILHRDIKPGNILLSSGHAILADFGVARALEASRGPRLTKTGQGIGTSGYMSPEQMVGDRDLDSRTDIYSLGCVVYEMLTGVPPFTGKTGFARRMKAEPPKVSARRDVPSRVDEAVARAMARDRDERFHSAREFARALGPS